MKTYAQKENKPLTQASPNLARSNAVRLQAKLMVNAPGDINEQEADRVATRVTDMPELQRSLPADPLQTKSVQANDVGEIEAPPFVTEALRSSGYPLDSSTRAFMEPRFGHDFSRVRVHTDARAAASAKAVNALAYTVSNHIAFSEGRFTPRTTEGRKLLAHELAHVVQSNQSVVHRQVAATPPQVKPTEVGESLIADFFNLGIGTVDNQTNKIFIAEASEKKAGPKLLIKLGPGEWGGSRPAEGPQGEKLRDIDFVFATPTTPINGQTKGKFKIGSNDAVISPDPKDNKNSEIDDFERFEG